MTITPTYCNVFIDGIIEHYCITASLNNKLSSIKLNVILFLHYIEYKNYFLRESLK